MLIDRVSGVEACVRGLLAGSARRDLHSHKGGCVAAEVVLALTGVPADVRFRNGFRGGVECPDALDGPALVCVCVGDDWPLLHPSQMQATSDATPGDWLPDRARLALSEAVEVAARAASPAVRALYVGEREFVMLVDGEGYSVLHVVRKAWDAVNAIASQQLGDAARRRPPERVSVVDCVDVTSVNDCDAPRVELLLRSLDAIVRHRVPDRVREADVMNLLLVPAGARPAHEAARLLARHACRWLAPVRNMASCMHAAVLAWNIRFAAPDGVARDFRPMVRVEPACGFCRNACRADGEEELDFADVDEDSEDDDTDDNDDDDDTDDYADDDDDEADSDGGEV